MDHGQWAVVVRALGNGEHLYDRNSGKLMVPASNMKIVTLAAAAQSMGWDTRFTTTLETAAPVEAGVLRGDLYVRGGGDPTINTRNGRGAAVFAEWTSALSAAGIRKIDGRIIGDDNLFDDEGLGAGWAWDYLQYGYAAPVGALQYNEDVADLVVTPGPAAGDPGGGQPLTGQRPDAVEQDHDRGRGHSRDDRLSPPARPAGSRGVGRRASAAASRSRGAQYEPPAGRSRSSIPTVYFVQSLKNALVAQGIEVTGDAVDIDDLAAPAPASRSRGSSSAPSLRRFARSRAS